MLIIKEECDLEGEMVALRYQHERNRHLIRQIENGLKPYADGDDIATSTLLENLASYISLLKRHIHMGSWKNSRKKPVNLAFN